MNLRDTIAAVIRERFKHLWNQADDIAEAVIQELALRQEWQTEKCRRVGIVSYNKPERPVQTRYVTDWQPYE